MSGKQNSRCTISSLMLFPIPFIIYIKERQNRYIKGIINVSMFSTHQMLSTNVLMTLLQIKVFCVAVGIYSIVFLLSINSVRAMCDRPTLK